MFQRVVSHPYPRTRPRSSEKSTPVRGCQCKVIRHESRNIPATAAATHGDHRAHARLSRIKLAIPGAYHTRVHARSAGRSTNYSYRCSRHRPARTTPSRMAGATHAAPPEGECRLRPGCLDPGPARDAQDPRNRPEPTSNRPHLTQPEPGPPGTDWLEVFYDLIYGVAIIELTNLLDEQPDWQDLLVFTAIFLPIWWIWMGWTVYVARVEADDPAHRVLTFIQMFAIAAMAVQVHEHSAASATFALAFVGAGSASWPCTGGPAGESRRWPRLFASTCAARGRSAALGDLDLRAVAARLLALGRRAARGLHHAVAAPAHARARAAGLLASGRAARKLFEHRDLGGRDRGGRRDRRTEGHAGGDARGGSVFHAGGVRVVALLGVPGKARSPGHSPLRATVHLWASAARAGAVRAQRGCAPSDSDAGTGVADPATSWLLGGGLAVWLGSMIFLRSRVARGSQPKIYGFYIVSMGAAAVVMLGGVHISAQVDLAILVTPLVAFLVFVNRTRRHVLEPV